MANVAWHTDPASHDLLSAADPMRSSHGLARCDTDLPGNYKTLKAELDRLWHQESYSQIGPVIESMRRLADSDDAEAEKFFIKETKYAYIKALTESIDDLVKADASEGVNAQAAFKKACTEFQVATLCASSVTQTRAFCIDWYAKQAFDKAYAEWEQKVAESKRLPVPPENSPELLKPTFDVEAFKVMREDIEKMAFNNFLERNQFVYMPSTIKTIALACVASVVCSYQIQKGWKTAIASAIVVFVAGITFDYWYTRWTTHGKRLLEKREASYKQYAQALSLEYAIMHNDQNADTIFNSDAFQADLTRLLQ